MEQFRGFPFGAILCRSLSGGIAQDGDKWALKAFYHLPKSCQLFPNCRDSVCFHSAVYLLARTRSSAMPDSPREV